MVHSPASLQSRAEHGTRRQSPRLATSTLGGGHVSGKYKRDAYWSSGDKGACQLHGFFFRSVSRSFETLKQRAVTLAPPPFPSGRL